MRQVNLGRVIKIAVLEGLMIAVVVFFIGFCSGRDYEETHPKDKVEVVE